jgi:hypothetical protein
VADDAAGFRKIKARDLSVQQQKELHDALQRELTEALIRKIQADPPDLDLTSIKLVLKPNQKISDWTVAADCGTCATCDTCSTCSTCVTHTLPADVPEAVIRQLNVKEKIQQN